MIDFHISMNNNIDMARKSPQDGKIRESIVDGIFYPAEENELRTLIDNLIQTSKAEEGSAFAIVAPHAGYSYAGEFIASSFKAASKRAVKNVVIIAPIHTDPEANIFLPESKFFLTPLGAIEVNMQLANEILSCSTSILQKDLPHLEEHCIEVHLPFIRHLFPDAKIVPILLGNSTTSCVKLLSNALQLTFAHSYSQTLFVVSANMTSHMNKENTEIETKILFDLINAFDWRGIIEAKASGRISSCGAGCISTILSFNEIEYETKIIATGSSEKQNEEHGEIVTYASIAINNKKEKV
jgi:AmmeMemoRadiSam system protein B